MRWLVPVVCGNDFYKCGRVVDFGSSWLTAVEEFCVLAAGKAERTLVVVGGSAAAWQYDKKFSKQQCVLYDSHVEKVRVHFVACGVAATTGEAELLGLELGDRIGHVSVRSETAATPPPSSRPRKHIPLTREQNLFVSQDVRKFSMNFSHSSDRNL